MCIALDKLYRYAVVVNKNFLLIDPMLFIDSFNLCSFLYLFVKQFSCWDWTDFIELFIPSILYTPFLWSTRPWRYHKKKRKTRNI